MTKLTATLVCLAALLGGCTGDEPAADVEPEAPRVAPTGAAVANQTFPFYWTVGVAAAGTSVQGGAVHGPSPAFMVPNGTLLLTVVAQWTCLVGPCDIHVDLLEPGFNLGLMDASPYRVTGASPLTVELIDPAPGQWKVALSTASPVNLQLEGTLSVSQEQPAP